MDGYVGGSLTLTFRLFFFLLAVSYAMNASSRFRFDFESGTWKTTVFALAAIVWASDALTTAMGEEPAAVSVEIAKSFSGHEADVYTVAVSPDNTKLATGSFDKTVRLWDVASGKTIAIYRGHEGKVMCVAFSPDGATLASGSQDKTVRLWTVVSEVKDGEPPEAPEAVKVLKENAAQVHTLAFSPDGDTLAAGTGAKVVHLWNLADGKEIRKIDAHASSVYCVAFSPDGGALATSGLDKAIKLWNVADGKELKNLSGHVEGVFTLTFSIDGKSIFSGSSDRTVRKWDVDGGKEVAVYEGHPGWVCGVGVLPGGKKLVSVDYGGNVNTWNLENGKVEARRRLGNVVIAMTLSPDGQWIATALRGSTAGLLPAK